MGRFKSRKSESFGFAEAVAFERELLAKVVEAGKFLVILMVAMEVCDDAPVVEGNGFGAEILVGPFAAGLDGAEKPSGGGGDGKRGVAWGGEDLLDVLLFVRTQFASDASSLHIVKGIEGADVY